MRTPRDGNFGVFFWGANYLRVTKTVNKEHLVAIRFIIILFLLISVGLFAQKSDSLDCYEVKYLDFFGLNHIEELKWPESEIKGLLDLPAAVIVDKSKIQTNFLVPLILFQVKSYHPDCANQIDTAYFNQLCSLYIKVRGLDTLTFSGKSVAGKIDFMRDDFYWLMANTQCISDMIFTFDDGPFFGEEFEEKATLMPLETLDTNFGQLQICNHNDHAALTCKNKEGAVIWQKLITVLDDSYLQKLTFVQNPMEYSSVGLTIHMYSSAERFTLYLKPDGEFMFYFYSW